MKATPRADIAALMVLLVALILFSESAHRGYSFARYLAALGLVELAYGLVTVYLGSSVLERRMAPILAGLASLALVSVWAAHTLRRRLAREGVRPGALAATKSGNDCRTSSPWSGLRGTGSGRRRD